MSLLCLSQVSEYLSCTQWELHVHVHVHGIIVHSIPARERYTRKNRKVSPPPPQKHTKITHMNTKHSEHHKTQHGSRTLGAQP